MFVSSIMLPAPAQEARGHIDRQVLEQISASHREWLAEQYSFLPANIRFKHNPHWRNQFWSITAAAHAEHPGWAAVRMLLAGGGALFGAVGVAPVAMTGGVAIALAVGIGQLSYDALARRRNHSDGRERSQPGS